MEGSYQKLILDLDARQKHILQLQSELLRVDYEYGVIVKDLKKQYSQIARQSNNNSMHTKQLKRQIKKLNSLLASKSRQNQQISSKVEDQKMRSTFMQESAKRIKQENQQLRNQIKYLQANQSKYQMKIQQANRKKQQSRQQCLKLQERIQVLQKQIKKLILKKKQLEQLVEQQVLQTKQRIQTMGTQLFSKNQFQLYQNNIKDFNVDLQQTVQGRLTIKSNPEQLINQWESDMKKLKNCIDYGSSYILVFDPMNLDRTISRQIFKFFKNCLKEKSQMENKLQQMSISQHQIANEHKRMLEHFENQLHKIAIEKDKKPTIDTQIQTQNIGGQQFQRKIIQLSELNTKLKIKNLSLLECLDYLTLRNVIVGQMLKNSHNSSQYFRKQIQIFKQSQPLKRSSENNYRKLKKVFNAIFFVMILQSKSKSLRKIKQNSNLKNKASLQVAKFRIQNFLLPGNRIKNVEIEKLKQKIVIQEQEIPIIMEEAIQYYEFKLKNILHETISSKQIIS